MWSTHRRLARQEVPYGEGNISVDLCIALTTSPVLFRCCPSHEMQLPNEGNGKENFPSFIIGFLP